MTHFHSACSILPVTPLVGRKGSVWGGDASPAPVVADNFLYPSAQTPAPVRGGERGGGVTEEYRQKVQKKTFKHKQCHRKLVCFFYESYVSLRAHEHVDLSFSTKPTLTETMSSSSFIPFIFWLAVLFGNIRMFNFCSKNQSSNKFKKFLKFLFKKLFAVFFFVSDFAGKIDAFPPPPLWPLFLFWQKKNFFGFSEKISKCFNSQF